MDEHQVGPDPRVSRVALAGPKPQPTYEEFMANVYLDVHGSLKFPADEYVILEEPLSSSRTLSSMKNLVDAYTIRDQFLNDKPSEDEPSKLNVVLEVIFMVTVPIHQASSLIPPLSTPIIDLSPPKLVSSTTQILHQRMFESGSYKSHSEHVALYEALEASMERANGDEFLAKKDKKKKLSKADLEGPVFKVVQPFHDNNISLQFQMEECHLVLTGQVDFANPEGHRNMFDVRKPLPLGGDKGRRLAISISKIKVTNYLDFVLEELVLSLWVESELEYDISAAYGISHWWFNRKEFYITRHDAPFITVKAHYKEYKISEANFKNLHPNDFDDLYLLHLQGYLNHLSRDDKVHLFNVVNLCIRNIIIKKCVEDLQLGIESYQTKLNLTQPDWDASDFLFKEDYTIVSKLRVKEEQGVYRSDQAQTQE
nr:hypothetical protein [Tanacetum cinerariifolium]